MTFAQAKPAVFDVVALLDDHASLHLGQVGTVVEELDEATDLVEFSDMDGRAYAIVPVAVSKLMVLHFEPQTA